MGTDGHDIRAGVVVRTMALFTSVVFVGVGAVAIGQLTNPVSAVPGALALTGGLTLLLGSGRLARGPFPRASALLVGLATALGAWPVVSVVFLSLVSAFDAIPRRPWESLGNFAIPALVVLVLWLSYQCASWRAVASATPDTKREKERFDDEFNEWIVILMMYMLVAAGAAGFAVVVASAFRVPH